MRFKPNPVMLALLAAPIIVCSTFYAHAATIDAWTPEANDAQVGATTVTNRSESWRAIRALRQVKPAPSIPRWAR